MGCYCHIISFDGFELIVPCIVSVCVVHVVIFVCIMLAAIVNVVSGQLCVFIVLIVC